MTTQEIRKLIHNYYIDSEIPDETGRKMQGVYPNAILMTKEQYKESLADLFNLEGKGEKITEKDLEHIKILSLEGLSVILTEHIESPKVIHLTVTK